MIDDGELGNKTEYGLDGYNGDNEKTPKERRKTRSTLKPRRTNKKMIL